MAQVTRSISGLFLLRSVFFKQPIPLTPIFSINRALFTTQVHKPERKLARTGAPPQHNNKPPSADTLAMNIQQSAAASGTSTSGAGIKQNNQEKAMGLEEEM